MDTPTIHEDHWRWRNDDGGEAAGGATWAEDEDVARDFDTGSDLDVNIRLRFSVHVEVAEEKDLIAQLQYSKNGGTWTDVNASSSVAQASDTIEYASGDDSTEHGVTFVGTGSFVANNNWLDDNDGDVGDGVVTDIAAQDYCAAELCIQLLGADLVGGDTVEFRLVVQGGTEFDGYPATHATANITTGAVLDPMAYLKRMEHTPAPNTLMRM